MKSKTNSDKLHSLKQSQPVSFNSTANKASPTSETTKHTTFPTCTWKKIRGKTNKTKLNFHHTFLTTSNIIFFVFYTFKKGEHSGEMEEANNNNNNNNSSCKTATHTLPLKNGDIINNDCNTNSSSSSKTKTTTTAPTSSSLAKTESTAHSEQGPRQKCVRLFKENVLLANGSACYRAITQLAQTAAGAAGGRGGGSENGSCGGCGELVMWIRVVECVARTGLKKCVLTLRELDGREEKKFKNGAKVFKAGDRVTILWSRVYEEYAARHSAHSTHSILPSLPHPTQPQKQTSSSPSLCPSECCCYCEWCCCGSGGSCCYAHAQQHTQQHTEAASTHNTAFPLPLLPQHSKQQSQQ